MQNYKLKTFIHKVNAMKCIDTLQLPMLRLFLIIASKVTVIHQLYEGCATGWAAQIISAAQHEARSNNLSSFPCNISGIFFKFYF